MHPEVFSVLGVDLVWSLCYRAPPLPALMSVFRLIFELTYSRMVKCLTFCEVQALTNQSQCQPSCWSRIWKLPAHMSFTYWFLYIEIMVFVYWDGPWRHEGVWTSQYLKWNRLISGQKYCSILANGIAIWCMEFSFFRWKLESHQTWHQITC